MKYYIRNNQVIDHKSSLTYSGETLYSIDAPEIQALLNPAPTEEQIAEQEIATNKAYLQNTDWYYARQLETGVIVPRDVVDARTEAREQLRTLGL